MVAAALVKSPYKDGDPVRPSARFWKVYPGARVSRGKVSGRSFVAGRVRVQWEGVSKPRTMDTRLIEPDTELTQDDAGSALSEGAL
jgi:hypothetical protein